MRYRDAGVDLTRSDALKDRLAPIVRSTWSDAIRDLRGGFAGVIAWPHVEPGGPAAVSRGRPLLAATLDGVGTKLHLALTLGRVPDAAADLVYHCANDLLAHGARPLAFLDYVAQSRLDPDVVVPVLEGLGRACREVGAALIGGETAEMPDTFLPGVVDVAGCMIGTVNEAGLLDGQAARPGDALLGLAATGLHTNGFSLARRVLQDSGLSLDALLPLGSGETLGEALLQPHRWYGRALLAEVERPSRERRVRALAHVTGGGLGGNLVRVLAEGVRARVRVRSWPRPPLVGWIVAAGAVPEEDARAALNLGIGMVVACAPRVADSLKRDLERAGETVHEIGELVDGVRGVEWVET